MYGGSEDVAYMYTDMLQRCENIFLSTADTQLADERLIHLSTFMRALANIIKQLHKVSLHS